MLKSLQYKGCLIGTTSIEGERKSDGVVPAHPGAGCLQMSRDRWLIFFATLDTRGWDSNRSILYQLRSGGPDGKLIKEGMFARCDEDWNLPGRNNERYFKSLGMPIAFGVPKDAVVGGRAMPNANVFVVKWYRWAHLNKGDKLLNAELHKGQWTRGPDIRNQTLRIEWAQFRLNDGRDDIELLTEPSELRQQGFENGSAFCSLGPNVFCNHSMKSPEPTSPHCREWVCFDTFVPYENGGYSVGHGSIAPVKFRFNEQTGLYQWVETGKLYNMLGRRIGETCLNRLGDDWILSARSFSDDYETCWWRLTDPFAPLGEPILRPNTPGPRMSFVCGDGRIRLFSNADNPDNGPYDRNPLCCWEVNPEDFSYGQAQIIAEAKSQGLAFSRPMLDMPKLCPAQGWRQILLFRAITQQHTASLENSPPITDIENRQAGIHYARLKFDVPAEPVWSFDLLNQDRQELKPAGFRFREKTPADG